MGKNIFLQTKNFSKMIKLGNNKLQKRKLNNLNLDINLKILMILNNLIIFIYIIQKTKYLFFILKNN